VATLSQHVQHTAEKICLSTYVLSATRFTLANRKFLTLLVKSTNSTNVLVANLNFKIRHMAFVKKDALGRLFLCLICFTASLTSASPLLSPPSCSSTQFDEVSQVRYIHDGDTLHLTDGRKIRLIGINTPELARKNRPAEAYSAEAKSTLKSLFKENKSISLVFGKDKKDHYGRYLAHAFLADNTNVQAVLLGRGLGSAIAIPPNTRFSACYIEQERTARCNKTGLWSNTSILNAKNLKKQHSGFHLIEGTVNSIKTDSKGIWLNLDDKLTVGIRPENQNLFDLKAINNMVNQTIIVRGWLNKSKKSNPFYLRVRHPLSIQRPSSHSCE
jgi:endonuclease YncB( thermonuclease family)